MHEKEKHEAWLSVFSRSENSVLDMSQMNEGISPVSVHSFPCQEDLNVFWVISVRVLVG